MMESNSTKPRYVLGRDYAACARLHYQHYLLQDLTGFILHPNIPSSGSSIKIADIGTGTGVWLVKLSKQISSSAQLDGFDVSASQFPPRESLPSNVSLYTRDAFESLPADLVGKYDVVHIAILAMVIETEDGFNSLLKNVISMLKPGGYLQWDELDLPNTKATPLSTGWSCADSSAEKMVAQFLNAGAEKYYWSWIDRLSLIFEKHGLKNVKTKRYAMSDELKRPWTNNSLLVLETVSDTMLRWANTDAEKTHALAFRETLNKTIEETYKGVNIGQDYLVTVGQIAGE